MTLILLLSLLQAPAGSPQAANPEMMTYQLVLLKQGPAAPPSSPDVLKKMQEDHLAHLAELNRARVNLIYGPMLDEGEIKGVAILDVPDAAAAKQAFASDPFVKAGAMVTEVHPWMGPRGWFSQPASYDVMAPGTLEPLIFGFFVRGANASQGGAAAADIQKRHLAYMVSLHQKGKLAVAGPLADEGRARGIVIYRAKDVAEAKALAADDPAVKAGRLALEAHPWMTFKGILTR
jgi:uncharacterized protein YciI